MLKIFMGFGLLLNSYLASASGSTAPAKTPLDVNLPHDDRYTILHEVLASINGTSRGGGTGLVKVGHEPLQSGDVIVTDLWPELTKAHSDIAPEFRARGETTEALALSYLDLALSRIEEKNPDLYRRLEASKKVLIDNAWVPADLPITPTEDQGEVSFDSRQYQLTNIAERRFDRVFYRKDLYDAMDALNRAALKLHEVIYAQSDLGDSTYTQKLVALAFSTRIETMSAKEFLKFLDQQYFYYSARPDSVSAIALPAQLQIEDVKIMRARMSDKSVRCGVFTDNLNEMLWFGSHWHGEPRNFEFAGEDVPHPVSIDRDQAEQLQKLWMESTFYLTTKYPNFQYLSTRYFGPFVCFDGNRISEAFVGLQIFPVADFIFTRIADSADMRAKDWRQALDSVDEAQVAAWVREYQVPQFLEKSLKGDDPVGWIDQGFLIDGVAVRFR